MGFLDFILLRRIEPLLRTDNQWLIKTPDNAPAFKTLGRWSRWRKSNDRFGSHAEVLETHLDLLEFAKRVGLFDVTKERYR
jgi:hypothetical protein